MGRNKIFRRVETEKQNDRRMEEVKFTLDLDWRIWIAALNNVHGHGCLRIGRTLREVNRLYAEYEDNRNCADIEYADAVLDRQVQQIMGDAFVLPSKGG